MSFPPHIKYGVNSSGNPEILRPKFKDWIPGHARNDKLYKIYVVMYRI
jgi:hypothetical protein